MAELLTAGIDCFIDAIDLVDADGHPLDVTGYTVEAVARAYLPDGPMLSRWTTSPGSDEGEIVVGGEMIDRIRLVVTAEQTSTWNAAFVVVQAEAVSPAGQTFRPIDTVYQIKREAVV